MMWLPHLVSGQLNPPRKNPPWNPPQILPEVPQSMRTKKKKRLKRNQRRARKIQKKKRLWGPYQDLISLPLVLNHLRDRLLISPYCPAWIADDWSHRQVSLISGL